MDDSPEVIRHQMEETKQDLAVKLETLERQVSDTVQSTGTVVTATVGAVQETVETVTGAVQDAVVSVGHAFDLRRQMDKHPLLIIGGAVFLGYVAEEFLSGPKKSRMPVERLTQPQSSNQPQSGIPPQSGNQTPASGNGTHRGNGVRMVPPAAPGAPVAAARQQAATNSSWDQLWNAAVGSVTKIIEDVAARAMPQIVDQITACVTETISNITGKPAGSEQTAEQRTASVRTPESDDPARHLYDAPAERMRFGNSF